MPTPDETQLVDWQTALERRLADFAATDLADLFGKVSEPAVHKAAAVYVTRPSKRLLGMAFLVQQHTLPGPNPPGLDDLLSVAAALEVRHAAILLHDDIVDGDTQRGGQPTAHHALADVFGADAGSAALFAGDVLAAGFMLPLLDCGLPGEIRARLASATMRLTALVAAGQCQQLHLDTVVPPERAGERRILAAHAAHFPYYLHCSTYLALMLAGIPEEQIGRVMAAAVPMSTAFQVQNDLAGFTELQRLLADGDDDDMLTLANTSDLARRRRTTVTAAAMAGLPAERARQLADYLAGRRDIPLAEVVSLVSDGGAVKHCSALAERRFAESHTALRNDPVLPAEVKDAVGQTWQWMADLYDPASPVSRLYLRARPDIVSADTLRT